MEPTKWIYSPNCSLFREHLEEIFKSMELSPVTILCAFGFVVTELKHASPL